MLECLDLPDEFGHIATDRRSQDLHCLNHSVWINQEAAPDVYACLFVIYSIDTPNAPTAIGQHRKWNATRHHLGELFFLPDLVGEAAICAD